MLWNRNIVVALKNFAKIIVPNQIKKFAVIMEYGC
jgi:hypothetical protein